jgi:hypothetical protein
MIEQQVRLFSKPVGKLDPADPNSPDRGAFTPETFAEWVGHEVVVTSLDPAYRHTLVHVENSPDGMQSLLTVHTYSDPGVDLTADLSIRVGTPKAQVRAYYADAPDVLVTTAWLDAHLTEGQVVTVNGAKHTVQSITWPYRDPEHPENTEDYQRVVLQATPDAPVVQALGLPPMAGPLLGMLA